MANTVIKVENISKQYRLGQVGTGTLAHDMNRTWQRVRGKEDPYLKIGEANDRSIKGTSDYVWALKDISFEVQQGEVLGIIGRNGAGKSTLLKILSRTTSPTTGQIKIKGRVASLLEVGTGFHPELSGRENIFLNGAILGMTKAEIKNKFDEIVDFAGVERYIDTPVKRYSSGMYVRLAFGVAAHLEPDILIVDEVLAVGDAEFQKKALGKMKDVSTKDGRTVLFVSHNLAAVKELCNKGLYLENGFVKSSGEINDVLNSYLKKDEYLSSTYINSFKNEKVLNIQKISILEEDNSIVNQHQYDLPFFILVSYIVIDELVDFYFAIHIHDSDFQTIIFSRNFENSKTKSINSGIGEYELKIKIPPVLVPGKYNISLHAAYTNPAQLIQGFDNICNFEIVQTKNNQLTNLFAIRGKFIANLEWDFTKIKQTC